MKEICSVLCKCFCMDNLHLPMITYHKNDGEKIIAVGIITPNMNSLPEKYRNRKASLYIANICTLPEYRKQGFCKGILNNIIQNSKKSGAKTLIIDVKAGNNVAYIICISLDFNILDSYIKDDIDYIILELVL